MLTRFILFSVIAISFMKIQAQTRQTQFQVNLSGLNARKSGSKDTIVIKDNDAFKIPIDATGLDANVSYKIYYLHGDEKEEVTKTIGSLDFNLKDRSIFSIEFHFCDKVTITDQVKVDFTSLKFTYDTTEKTADGKDTTINKEDSLDVRTEDQSTSIIQLNNEGKKIKDISLPLERTIEQPRDICKEERTVTIIFKKPETEKTETQKNIDALNERISSVLNQDPEFEPIGEMTQLTTDVSIKKTGTEIRKSKVKRIEITFEHGAIGRRLLRVEMEDGSVFFNKQAPINLPRIFVRKKDCIYRYDSRSAVKDEYIELGDVLDYHYFGKFNYPADGNITLSTDKLRDTLRVGSSINSLLDVSVYTDLLGLLGNKPNGILQTEVAGNFISNTANIKNTDFIFHNFMRPYIRLSKFDSKFKSLDSLNIKAGANLKDTVNRTYLNQISYFQGGLMLNIVRVGLGVNQLIYLNAGADINLVNSDIIYKKDIVFFNYYPELNYTITRLKNFGMDCSLRFLRQRVGENSPFVNREAIWIFKPQMTIYYYPSKDASNKVYLRMNYFDNLKDSGDNFPQFQLGFKTNLKSNK